MTNSKLMTMVVTALTACALVACTQTRPNTTTGKLDSTGSYYQANEPDQGVGNSMRNTTANETADRPSTRYPVGSAGQDSNPY